MDSFLHPSGKVSTKPGQLQSISQVDVVGDVGKYSGIVVDSGNVVHIAYYDATNGDLKYATLAP